MEGCWTHLSCRLVETELVSELLLGHGSRGIDLVSENQEWNSGEGLDGHWDEGQHCRVCTLNTGNGVQDPSANSHNESSSALLSWNRSVSAESTKKTIPSTSGK